MCISDRDTCLCVKHENIHLVYAELKKLKVVDGDLDSGIEKFMCCSPATTKCYVRECDACFENLFLLNTHDHIPDTRILSYFSWHPIQETGRQGMVFRRIMKKRIECSIVDLMNTFFSLLPQYVSHIGRQRHQYKVMLSLKENLTSNEALMHVDFSENFSCKYHKEIQSTHFGANRQQVTLHTGVLYSTENVYSFCSISDDLRHDPTAIWGHLQPVLLAKCTELKSLHIQSDSPPSQYRNKFMMYVIMKKIIPFLPLLETFTWNFTESGHGKRAADGIGGAIKRTCDKMVANNVLHIPNYTAFCQSGSWFEDKN